MKLAELCTAFPETAGVQDFRHPASAVPHLLRLKLRTQRGYLQAALDSHPQKSPSRLGLGLRPYEAGDSLRAVSFRHLQLQEQLLTRTDVSAGRFHVSIIIHTYDNMNFKSDPEGPSKNQLAWLAAALLQNLHEQQAQKVDILPIADKRLTESIQKHAARIRRSHFCYLITDLFHNSESAGASVRDVLSLLELLHIRRGLVVLVRDPLESPENPELATGRILTFESPEKSAPAPEGSPKTSDLHSGKEYLDNLKSQYSGLQQAISQIGWGSLLTTAEDELDDFVRQLSIRLAGQRMSQ
jgi:disulfide oxidoreductase YuzD